MGTIGVTYKHKFDKESEKQLINTLKVLENSSDKLDYLIKTLKY